MNRKEYQRNWVKQKRDAVSTKDAKVSTISDEMSTELEVNQSIIESVTHSPRVLHLAQAVTDPVKRRKLQAIVDAFADSKRPEYAKMVQYGVDGPDIATLSTVLDITK